MPKVPPKSVPIPKPVHDAVRHSTAQTPVRESLEAWNQFRKDAQSTVDKLYGEFGRITDTHDEPNDRVW